MWFPKGNKSQLVKFTKKWFKPYIIQYVLQNNITLLVTIEKFETNLVLVNVNKFKPYKPYIYCWKLYVFLKFWSSQQYECK
jgi:hypothetical protein